MAPTDHRDKPGMDRSFPASTRPRGQAPSGAELGALGLFLAAAVLIPLLAGIVLDAILGHGGRFLFAGLLLGVIAGAGVVYTRFRRYL